MTAFDADLLGSGGRQVVSVFGISFETNYDVKAEIFCQNSRLQLRLLHANCIDFVLWASPFSGIPGESVTSTTTCRDGHSSNSVHRLGFLHIQNWASCCTKYS